MFGEFQLLPILQSLVVGQLSLPSIRGR